MDVLQVKLLIVGVYDQEFFELVKSVPKDANRSSKVACRGESLSLWMTNFDLFKN